MKKRTKVAALMLILAVIVGCGSILIKRNIEHQKELHAQQLYNKKINIEKKEVEDLQKRFSVENGSAAKEIINLEKLNLTTKEAKKIQSDYVEKDKKEFYSHLSNKIDQQDISSKDARFNNVDNLQSNIDTLNDNIKNYQEMGDVLNKNQIAALASKVNEITKKEKSQITKINAEAAEKARLAAEAEKVKQEQEEKRIRQEEATDQTDTSTSKSKTNSQTTESVPEWEVFRRNFKEQYGREPSSGEMQMDWLRKQGIVK